MTPKPSPERSEGPDDFFQNRSGPSLRSGLGLGETSTLWLARLTPYNTTAMQRIVLTILLTAATLLGHAQARAQTPLNDDRPIDQNVEDVDPRATSFRVIDPGNARHPTRSMIVERAHQAKWARLGLPALDQATGLPDTRRYEYRAPGVRAQMDRPDYRVIDQTGEPALNRVPLLDGAFEEMPPPNTVFDLVPERPDPHDPTHTDPDWRDPRVDGRIDRRLGRADDTYHPGGLNPPRPEDRRPVVERFKIRRLHAKKYDDEKTEAQETQTKPADEKDQKKPSPEPQAEPPQAEPNPQAEPPQAEP